LDAAKLAFLDAAGPSLKAQDSRKVSINSALRSAKSLFSQTVLELIRDKIELPSPLPFEGVKYIKHGGNKYRSEWICNR
jgi:hypothetical protein